jgi:benzoyl-CoA 2,3-dioxygenase component B
MRRRLNNYDDWQDFFKTWQDDLGLDDDYFLSFKYEPMFGEVEVPEIEFGHYRGRLKWNKVMEIPDQRIRDALLTLIVVQGDTEFASVEQQRLLVNSYPSEYDLRSLQRVMAEEMRHGIQMSYVLCEHFGREGLTEARKLLERTADEGKRLLGSFNEHVENWLDFFTYTQFIDRDGKFQLRMLSTSAFAPLAASMPPMLREESFHLGTGHTGLKRVVKVGVVPSEIIQRYFNKWIPTAYDLFGNDSSTSAQWAYVWGLKGRYDERQNARDADQGKLNQYARQLYFEEVQTLVKQLNRLIPDRDRWLKVPSIKFNRKIGDYAGQPFDVEGNLLDPEQYREHLKEVLPTQEDREYLDDLEKNSNDWVEERKVSTN